MTIKIYFDGLCEPRNPGGYACYGWLIVQDGHTLASGKGLVTKGDGATNNVAEYQALIEALKAAADLELGDQALEVMGDSQLVINQVNGDWQCRAGNLQPLLAQARRLAGRLPLARFKWIPREKNEPADRLSREAYYEARPKTGAKPDGHLQNQSFPIRNRR